MEAQSGMPGIPIPSNKIAPCSPPQTSPSGAAQELDRRQDTGEREGGGKELLGHVKYMSKWDSSGSKQNKPRLGQPQRLQLTGNPSGEVQVLGRGKKPQNFPHPSFSPFLVTIFRASSYRSMPQWRHRKREGRRDFHRSSLFHYIFFLFINLFPIKETVDLQLFIGVQI